MQGNDNYQKSENLAALLDLYYHEETSNEVYGKIRKWMDSICENTILDVFHEKSNTWYEAKVLERHENKLKLHYLFWNDKHDEEIDISTKPLIYPRNTYTTPRTRKKRVVKSNEPVSNGHCIDIATPVVITTKSGRKSVRKAVEHPGQKKRKTSDDSVPDRNEWICAICDQLEAFDDSNLILCDGPCLRSFHIGCLCLNSNDIPDSAWLCDECTSGQHTCFMCGDTGIDNIEVRKCSIPTCGKHYHYRCLVTSDAPYCLKSTRLEGEAYADDDASGFKFRCPYHFCDVCHFTYGGKDSRSTLHRCFKCPRSYHINCIPPGTRFNALALLCPDHPNEVLPSREPSDRCMPSNNALNNIWDQMPLPEIIPGSTDNNYLLSTSIKEDVASQPPTFKMIWKLDYDKLSKDGIVGEKLLPYHVPNETCECVSRCGDECLNRLLKFECWDPPKGSICAIGNDCGNRQFVQRDYIKVKPFREHKMGWGLKTLEFVARGRLVIEYIGEVIDEQEMQARMVRQRNESPNDHDFYIMELDNGFFVDGKFKGNLSRFINHSCNPNCELQRWVVRGRTRIGIMAIRDIAENEPLSYDYQFDTREEDTFKCYCGARNCRGTMAPKRKVDKNTLTKAEKIKFIQVGKQRDKKTDEWRNSTEWRRSYTGKYAPGDGLTEVKLGPLPMSFGDARAMHLFLPRNTRTGGDFAQRRKLASRGNKMRA